MRNTDLSSPSDKLDPGIAIHGRVAIACRVFRMGGREVEAQKQLEQRKRERNGERTLKDWRLESCSREASKAVMVEVIRLLSYGEPANSVRQSVTLSVRVHRKNSASCA